KAEITEIFSSIQGEGIFLGAKQIFVRFRKCNLDCIFCDELKGLPAREYSPIELMKEVKALEASAGPHHSVSLTGGEPLLCWDFLRTFLKMLKKARGLKAYLETNGTLPHELAKIIDSLDIVAMDFKLPSSTGGRSYWHEHAEFLKIASKRIVFVKAVVTPDTDKKDIEKAVQMIKRLRKNVPFILQPASPVKPDNKIIGNDRLLGFLDIGLKNDFNNIRVIPQIHKILKVK
ncbi:MAG: 7-carboxy-7-deazaguanine synthase QueE, partial [Candidatus Omnitrophota bacterium]|nr:7-carboxy-7-deazaguanine synthase QueE [Candidatus Omnitrophota bacterium]